MQVSEKIFREYDIRGVADRDLTDPVIEAIARGVSSLIVAQKKGKTITLGRDCRTSSNRIAAALTAGFTKSGIDVIDVGLVPTPLLYFSVAHFQADGGIMITGSHNPSEYNGLKICVGPSTIHGEEIQEIRKIVGREEFPVGVGKVQKREIISTYIDHVCKDIKHPIPLNVVVDSGNGMAGIVAPELYRRLGCHVTDLFSDLDGTFPNHHPDPTVLENLEDLKREVATQKAVCGIGFDGDADRIGVIDASGQILFGDELLVIYARDVLEKNPGCSVISEVKASHRLFQDVKAHGGIPIMWKTGHSLIKAKMKETGALLAGEMSGHMFFADRYYGFDDAIYAGARLLEILHKKSSTPSKLLADLPKSFTTPEIRVDCSDEIKFSVVSKAREAFQSQGLNVNGIDGARVEFGDGWGLVRASNTQPVLVYRFEATSQKRLNEIRGIVESTVAQFISR